MSITVLRGARLQGRKASSWSREKAGKGTTLGCPDNGPPVRFDLERQAPADSQRQRQALRLAGIFDRRAADPRPGGEHPHELSRSGARPRHPPIPPPRPPPPPPAPPTLALFARPTT